MPLSFAGPFVNTSGSEDIPWPSGTGCARSNGATRPCLPTGAWDQRSDDGSRMNREVHVRFWESAVLKCAALLAYLNAYESVAEAKAGIGTWLSFYNEERQHQSLGYRTPRQIYQEGLWICGRSASPTGCASPAFRASSEGGEMLAFAHIPTGATANEGFNINEMNNRFAEPAVALTATGADIETGRVTP